MQSEQEIIVFKKFDNAIEANITKTNLDAHGIPCFLTEENLSNLYPGQNFMFSVRLHIFAKDEERALNVISTGNMQLSDDVTKCPRCSSLNLERDFPKRFNDSFQSSLKVIFGVFFLKEKVYRCIECEHEFDLPL